MSRLALALLVVLGPTQAGPRLTITMVGNAGVLLTDSVTSLLLDLPYEAGAFGYQEYRPESVRPPGTVVSVVTHHHRDHFAAELMEGRDGWRVLGPPSVLEGVAPARRMSGDSVTVGAFHVVVVPTPHTPDHRSYRIRWRGRVLHFTGDTEDPSALAVVPAPDVLFTTPWFGCAAAERNIPMATVRTVAYHLDPGGSDRICRGEPLAQGSVFSLDPGRAPEDPASRASYERRTP